MCIRDSSWNDGTIQFTFRPSYEKDIEIFSLQGAVQPEIRYYTDQQSSLTGPVCEISSSQIGLYDYVIQEIRQAEDYQAAIPDVQYYNVFAKELEACTCLLYTSLWKKRVRKKSSAILWTRRWW